MFGYRATEHCASQRRLTGRVTVLGITRASSTMLKARDTKGDGRVGAVVAVDGVQGPAMSSAVVIRTEHEGRGQGKAPLVTAGKSTYFDGFCFGNRRFGITLMG